MSERIIDRSITDTSMLSSGLILLNRLCSLSNDLLNTYLHIELRSSFNFRFTKLYEILILKFRLKKIGKSLPMHLWEFPSVFDCRREERKAGNTNGRFRHVGCTEVASFESKESSTLLRLLLLYLYSGWR